MAERDKDALDADVESSLAGSKLHWVTRRGSPHSLQDLELVAAAHAKTVILLHPEADGVRWSNWTPCLAMVADLASTLYCLTPHIPPLLLLLLLPQDVDAEVHKTATILGLQSSRSHPSTTLRRQRVVLQNPDAPPPPGRASEAQQAAAAQHSIGAVVQRSLPDAANMRLVEVNGNRNIARLIAQSAVQPGVSSILGQIVQSVPGAPDFHVLDGVISKDGITYQVSGWGRVGLLLRLGWAGLGGLALPLPVLVHRLPACCRPARATHVASKELAALHPPACCAVLRCAVTPRCRRRGASWSTPWPAATSRRPTARRTSTRPTASCCSAATA